MSTENKQKICPFIFDTYRAVIKNSVGCKLFHNFYAEVNGKRTDIMRNGELSCAFYVSSVLALFKMVKEIHGTVDSTAKNLLESGWRVINKQKVGSVVIWENFDFNKGDTHRYIGFYVGGNEAISNSYKLGYPVKHHWTFEIKRKVDIILQNPKLN